MHRYSHYHIRLLSHSIAFLSIWVATASAAFAEPVRLHSGDQTLAWDGHGITVTSRNQTVLALESLRFNFTEPESWKLLSATGDAIRLELSFPARVEFMHHATDEAPRKAILVITREPAGFRFRAAPEWGAFTTLEFRSLGDHFFGLSEPLQPDNQHSPDLTGTSIDVEVASEPYSIAENFASALSAFYMSSFGYGAFFDTFARGRYDFAINGKTRIHHETGKLDWYLFFGDNGTEIHRAYFDLIGEPKQLPLWAMGPIGWRDDNKGGAEEILDDLSRMRDLRIPLTAWWVDRPYSDGAHAWSEMNFNEQFANPGEWIRTIRKDYHMEFMTWVATAMFGDERFPRNLGGVPTYIDLSDPATVELYQQELMEKQYAYGVRGHKMDRADENFPVHESWADRTPKPERQNRYVYLYAKVHHEVLLEAWGTDQLNFARAAYHRTQPYLSAIWGGDSRTSWDGLRGNLANAIRSGFIGFPVWGSDVGGYIGEGRIPEDLYLRWVQFGIMSGMFEIKFDGWGGAGEDRLPWHYSEDFQESLRKLFEERMRLIPYLFSLANTSAETGVMMQPMAYRHLGDPNCWPIWDQFYLGESIMVAPVVTRGTAREVYLPAGRWHEFGNPARIIEGGQTITVQAELGSIPRFLPENSLYLTGTLPVGSPLSWSDPQPALTVHAIPGETGSSTAFTYVDPLDLDARKIIKMVREGDTIQISAPPVSCPLTIELWLPGSPAGNEWTDEYDSGTGILKAEFPANEQVELSVGIRP